LGSSLFCWEVSFLHLKQWLSGFGIWSRWINALGVVRLGDWATRRMRPVRSCPWSCDGLSVIFWPCRCRYSGLSMRFRAACFHFCGVVLLSLGGFPCAIRHTSSHASRCVS
jgi:hypothetical protein